MSTPFLRVRASLPLIVLCGAMVVGCGDADPPEAARSFGAIDRERLLAADAEPGQWLTEGRDFGKGHYSPLDQINVDTVATLGFAWEYATGTTRGLQATPIVVDGVLYTSGTTGRAYAVDAATGAEIWSFDPESDSQYNRWACCDEVNRGLAVWEGMVYVGSFDGRLFGLDAATGAVVWEVDTIIDHDRGYTSSGAPEIAGSVVVIGNGGADYDARGYVSAYDLKTGEFKWRFFTVPGDPALGYEHPELEEIAAPTWDPNSRWDVGGGGTAWNAMVYDPELNLLYVGTGNAALFNWRERSPSGGDNLFLCSILAIDPDTGRLAWYYQQVPREGWDYTATQPMILADLEIDGETRKVLMQAPKAGFFYILDRATGELLSADPYVPVNWATHVDLETGRPAMNPAVDYRNEPVFVLPSGMGGHAWNPMAFSPETGLVYIPAIEGGAITYDPSDGHVYRPKQANSGNSTLFGASMLANPAFQPPAVRELLTALQASGQASQRAVLKAFDPETGEVRWEQETAGFWDRAGVLATAGGLVFQGSDTGHLKAFDASTGTVLLDLELGTSIVAAPMSYAINDEQYIAIMAGWGGGGWFAPDATSAVVRYGNAGRIIAFKLGGDAVPVPQPVSAVGPIPEPPAQTGTPEQIRQGQQLFARSCSLCHANSDIGMTPDLRRMSADTHTAFNAIVLNGARRFRGMPQWDDVLDVPQTEAIHAYLIDLAWQAYAAQSRLPDIEIVDTEVFPESITASADGTVFAGSVKGNVYRAEAGSATATPWIRTTPENGILSILGVLADDASNTLWLCSVPNFFGTERSQGVSSLMAFDLTTAAQKGVYPFPAPASVCNDVAIAADGSAFASDTSNGRIFVLRPGASSLELYGADAALVGIDGLAFSGDGTLYVNNVQSNQILRVETDASGAMTGLTTLALSHELGGPDGFRLIEGNRCLPAEGTIGRLAVLTIDGARADLEIIDDTLVSSPGATAVGDTAYVLESNIGYLTDPNLRGQQPESCMIYARPLPQR